MNMQEIFIIVYDDSFKRGYSAPFIFYKIMSNRENTFQKNLIQEIKIRFPECTVLKNDSSYIQGIPDLLILFKDKWAALECKKSSNATHQPNQDFYITKLNNMSFARYIYPENKEEILNELQQSFRS
jgi:hypothetical protein